MLPPAEILPDVLPNDRLTAAARPVPALRESLRKIPVRVSIDDPASLPAKAASISR